MDCSGFFHAAPVQATEEIKYSDPLQWRPTSLGVERTPRSSFLFLFAGRNKHVVACGVVCAHSGAKRRLVALVTTVQALPCTTVLFSKSARRRICTGRFQILERYGKIAVTAYWEYVRKCIYNTKSIMSDLKLKGRESKRSLFSSLRTIGFLAGKSKFEKSV